MRVIVLGAGVIGVTSAWYLSQAGHEVEVLEKLPGPAQDCSHANGGQLSVSHSAPWAAPGVPRMAFAAMFDRQAPLRLRPDFSLRQLRWIRHMLGECTAPRAALNRSRMLRLSAYSRDCLHALEQRTGIEFEGRRSGILHLFQDQMALHRTERQLRQSAHPAVRYEMLASRSAAERIEPALEKSGCPVAGALYFPGEASGDCALFTRRLAALAETRGVVFRYGIHITGVATRGKAIEYLAEGDQRHAADAYVFAAGAESSLLLSGLAKVPVYPVKGYSLTAPLRRPAASLRVAMLYDARKLAITCFDDRVRVAAFADVVGHDRRLDAARCAQLRRGFEALFPECADLDGATYWCGLRPMTPDGTPIIGASAYTNLYLNTGHGTFGWTMSCGSGQLIADIVSGRRPAIPHEDLSLLRYERNG